MTHYELTTVKATLNGEMLNAILVHDTNEEFHDGDRILIDYSLSSLDSDETIDDALFNDGLMFDVNEDGYYVVE